jgi:anti-sigma factor ChrR (cupin superfamily)
MILRMEAGSRYRSHRHTQVEELFLFSGDLHIEDQVMHAGDYCRADLGSVHDLSYSEGGCVFLLMASPDYQLLV